MGLFKKKPLEEKLSTELTPEELLLLLKRRQDEKELKQMKQEEILSHMSSAYNGLDKILTNDTLMRRLIGTYENGETRSIIDATKGEFASPKIRDKKRKDKIDRGVLFTSPADLYEKDIKKQKKKSKKKKKKKEKIFIIE